MKTSQQKALIYCRVSDPKQKTDGHGLESQELRCRQFADTKDLLIERVFHDDVTGGGDFNKRPAMVELLDHLKRHRNTNYIVIFDDIKRASRDIYFYWQLIYQLDEYGAQPMSPNFVFEKTPEGKLQQSITVAAGEYERESNARQTRQKMIARLEQGFHVFIAPVGFKYKNTKTHGKVLVRDEPAASVIAEAMEGYASGRFQTRQEVRYFLEKSPGFPKAASGKLGNVTAEKILTEPLYAGYVGFKPWSVELRKGFHQGMVSFETFCKIQERLNGTAYAPTRKDFNVEFPLRGSVLCECGNALTAAMSRSRTGKLHPYYKCQNKKGGCKHAGKSIRRDVIEDDFEKLLQQLTPSKKLVVLADKIFRRLWDKHALQQEQLKLTLKKQTKSLEQDVEKTLNKIVEADSLIVIKRLENRIEELESKKLMINEKIANCGRPVRPYDEMYRTALRFLAEPHKVWAYGGYKEKMAVKKLVLSERITYVRNEGYRTTEFSLPFRLLADFSGSKNGMVPGALPNITFIYMIIKAINYIISRYTPKCTPTKSFKP